MSFDRPTLASCLHCRAILLHTNRALIHPTGADREEIQVALSIQWNDHPSTRFDGRFHNCLGLNPAAHANTTIVINSEPTNRHDQSNHSGNLAVRAYQGPHLSRRIGHPLAHLHISHHKSPGWSSH